MVLFTNPDQEDMSRDSEKTDHVHNAELLQLNEKIRVLSICLQALLPK